MYGSYRKPAARPRRAPPRNGRRPYAKPRAAPGNYNSQAKAATTFFKVTCNDQESMVVPAGGTDMSTIIKLKDVQLTQSWLMNSPRWSQFRVTGMSVRILPRTGCTSNILYSFVSRDDEVSVNSEAVALREPSIVLHNIGKADSEYKRSLTLSGTQFKEWAPCSDSSAVLLKADMRNSIKLYVPLGVPTEGIDLFVSFFVQFRGIEGLAPN